MWSSPELWKLVSFSIGGVLAVWGFVDYILDEVERRRSANHGLPKGRKRFGSLLVGFLGLVQIAVTWQLDHLSDAEQRALEKRIESLNTAAREQKRLQKQVATLSQSNLEMDRAANAVAQARIGMRDGIESLLALSRTSPNSDVRARTQTLLASVSADYERQLQRELERYEMKSNREKAEFEVLNAELSLPITPAELVKVIATKSAHV